MEITVLYFKLYQKLQLLSKYISEHTIFLCL